MYLCSLPMTMSVMVKLNFSCAQASAWSGCKKEICARGWECVRTSDNGEHSVVVIVAGSWVLPSTCRIAARVPC
jgi:hypothetical protein